MYRNKLKSLCFCENYFYTYNKCSHLNNIKFIHFSTYYNFMNLNISKDIHNYIKKNGIIKRVDIKRYYNQKLNNWSYEENEFEKYKEIHNYAEKEYKRRYEINNKFINEEEKKDEEKKYRYYEKVNKDSYIQDNLTNMYNGSHNNESTYKIKNEILNRHEKIDLNSLHIDEEIINNLKIILNIDKLYMYQYIIYNEILKNSKHLLIYNKTGTGKTLSYLLPLIQKLINDKFDCNKKVLIITQNIYLCKQLYIYILSIYPTLNVCILSDEKESFNINNDIIIDKKRSNNDANNIKNNNDVCVEKYGIHFYLCTPNKLEYFIKSYKNKSRNDKNVMNNILNNINTIVIDEFDYIVEYRKNILNFIFKKELCNEIQNNNNINDKNKYNHDTFNKSNYNIYLFTANINEVIKKKIYEHLNGFVFFDFINGIKEHIQKQVPEQHNFNINVLKNSENVIQLLSKENKNPSLCNLNITHFVCKINTASKYKYVCYFLDEFFFHKQKSSQNINKDVAYDEYDKLDYRNMINMEENKYVDHSENEGNMRRSNDEKINKCIIFANTKEEVEKLYEISLLKPHAVMMHSELLTIQKNENINLFKVGKKNVLITTDIISRGLDIDNVIFILNYSPPASPNDYIHRSGRTGRGKEKGICLTMYHKYEYRNVDKIMKYTKNKFEVILCPKVEDVYKFSVDKLVENVMKIAPEKYEFFNEKSKELLKNHNTKIIAQILSILLKFDKKSCEVSLLSGKKNYVAVLIKDPFFEVIKNRDDIINIIKVITGNKMITTIIGEVAKCDEGFIVDISSSHVNKIISLFNSSNFEYKNKGLEINTLIELPPIIKEKKNIIRRKKKAPWITYKLQKKKIIILGRKTEKYKRKRADEIIKDINKNI
ncbi:ATP-dependent RNA helicase, putative [Plasmodium sp. gorilla clade G2]|uniref:ATP-dependent RNA helicase, putative n=1 Tax=Plasmodium sp. gorilla clade G2 TaxID=880535 RepID=UPI000D22B4A6|nr:ATP-dependent RNA helicase, putative [Plasmodium sp. gorilla clade G2]SOV16439.1 ATP-dependent RNA helicase, putative [Plasmodium sp. gorilla clade G2]